MIETVKVRIEVKEGKKILRALSDATSVDNRIAPEGIHIRETVNETLLFELFAKLESGKLSILTVKHTITDFLGHLRTAFEILQSISDMK
ncbi:MAG: hypothetical protein GWO20_09850 [Candidatus Korarchaeota archaeon]|nr:hypothetical protein [Candidatus Korarchaeota archaeon]NIU85324.1 hypothetical protein [Candidatus Thorarchaeota archaeon]NIW13957.1 hypothetical protein [Candidatus Thorarchaeota archaeon]NIW52096.1 hypothetical protein [Candidatus Korarchaeota archaeon]